MIRRILYRITANLPCRLIKIEDKPYLERYYLGTWFGVTCYLHRFVSGDGDRAVHDHPWTGAAALVLAGGYREERLVHMDPATGWAVKLRRMFPGRVNFIGRRSFHRITETKPETWTLFMHARRCKGWGFLETSNTGVVVYHQPLDLSLVFDWWHHAPKGADSGREPYGKAAA